MSIDIQHIDKHFGAVQVLSDVRLSIDSGELVALLGPSGCGKTTLLRIIAGLEQADRGHVAFHGQDMTQVHVRERQVGFVFQHYNLMPTLNAERNVELPLLLTHLSKAERRKHVAAALEVVGLSHRAKHFPRTLSGGEQQRVGIARGIVTDPTLLLCDEPTGDLDRKAGDGILDLLQALNRQHGKTIIMVTHDPHASARASRTVHLDKGQLSAQSAP